MAQRLTVAIMVFLIASLAFMVFSSISSVAAATTTVFVDPPEIIDEALGIGSTFNVSLRVTDIPADPGIVGIELKLSWNESVLKGVSMQELIFHEVMPTDELDNLWKLKQVVSNGSIHYAYTFQDIDRALTGGYAPISGSHIIANVTLQVVGIGETALHFDVSKLGDPTATPLPNTVEDGFFSNLPPPPEPEEAFLFVNPEKIENASLTQSNNFTINVDIANASALSGLEFKLGFNASVLNANWIVNGSFLPASVTPVTEIDNGAGFVRFNVSLVSPLEGDGTVAVIEFHVEMDNVRNSPLNLYDVVMVDSDGEALPFTTADGSFTNSETIPGDLNEDGSVGLEDAILASHAFGSKPGDPNWDPLADMDGNGEIDIFDLILLVSNFGRTA